ncbi:hypothetical protein M514_05299 [Trichuris suis]|uniref:Uncharacterized protein n=1 Tax=Trichuris suis TaxID=68888 RepID=A0A085NQ42_9BILA|nr:hypothetical protein M513_05299 [Trichuris suis]KFD71588.1 hypothetical protein M514_05299 [Trichuris suis]
MSTTANVHESNLDERPCAKFDEVGNAVLITSGGVAIILEVITLMLLHRRPGRRADHKLIKGYAVAGILSASGRLLLGTRRRLLRDMKETRVKPVHCALQFNFLVSTIGFTSDSKTSISYITDFIKKALSLVFQDINICPIEVIELLARFVDPRYPAAEDACSFSGLLLPSNNSNAYLKCRAGKNLSINSRDINAISDTVLKWSSSPAKNSAVQNRRAMQTITEHLFKTRADEGAMNRRIPLGMFSWLPLKFNCGVLEQWHCPNGMIFDFFRQKCDKDLLFGKGVRRFISLSKTNTSFLERTLHVFRKSAPLLKAIPDLTLAFLAMAKNPVATAFGLAKVFASSPNRKVKYTTLLEEAARHVDDHDVLNSGGRRTESSAKYTKTMRSMRSAIRLVPNDMLDFIMESIPS